MNCLHHIICFYQMNSLLLRKKRKYLQSFLLYEIGFFSFHLVSFVSYLFRFDIATWAKDANYSNNRKIIIYKIQAYQMLCFFNFFSSNSSSSIHFFLSASIRMPFIWLVIFCLFSLKKINRRQKNRKRKKQKQNKTVYRLCSYRLVTCFIGSAIAHGAQKAADIVLTYVFM